MRRWIMNFRVISSRDLVKLDMLVTGEPVDALSLITHRDNAALRGRQLSEKLKEVIPRQMYRGCRSRRRSAAKSLRGKRSRQCARMSLPSVTAETLPRKRKLLEKQKEGKKRMKQVGSVELPQEAFLAVLKVSE